MAWDLKQDLKQGLLKQVSRSNGGVPKYAIQGSVLVTASGVEGDRQLDLVHHGGPDKTVLMIASEVIEDLAVRGFPVFAGALGENLTVSGLDPHLWRAGQRYRIGEDLVIELTKLREPCANLYRYGISIGRELYDSRCREGDITSPHWAHGGFYARVPRAGLVAAGAIVQLESDMA